MRIGTGLHATLVWQRQPRTYKVLTQSGPIKSRSHIAVLLFALIAAASMWHGNAWSAEEIKSLEAALGMTGNSIPIAGQEVGVVRFVQTAQAEQSDKAKAARRAYDKRDWKTAFPLWSELAEDGDPDAQSILGTMYENGEGVAQDPAEAAKWYRKAADQGHSDAQLNLGVLYENGEGVPKDEVQAAKWYRKAAKQGELLAQHTLGLMYRQGRGVPQDNKQAARWLSKVAKRGYALAQVNLAFMYAEGVGVPKDDAAAVKLFREAADNGHPVAQNNLGLLYGTGRGVNGLCL